MDLIIFKFDSFPLIFSNYYINYLVLFEYF